MIVVEITLHHPLAVHLAPAFRIHGKGQCYESTGGLPDPIEYGCGGELLVSVRPVSGLAQPGDVEKLPLERVVRRAGLLAATALTAKCLAKLPPPERMNFARSLASVLLTCYDAEVVRKYIATALSAGGDPDATEHAAVVDKLAGESSPMSGDLAVIIGQDAATCLGKWLKFEESDAALAPAGPPNASPCEPVAKTEADQTGPENSKETGEGPQARTASKTKGRHQKKASMAKPSANALSQPKAPPWFPLYPGDFLSSASVQSMDPLEEGGYFHLLCIEWQQLDCGLPNNDNELAALSRLGERWWKKPHRKATMTCGERIRKSFFIQEDRLFNRRLLQVRKEFIERRRAMSEAGKEGASKRWGGHRVPIGVPIGRPQQKDGHPKAAGKGHGVAMQKPMAFDSSSSSSSYSYSEEEEPPTPFEAEERNGYDPTPGCQKFLDEYSGQVKRDWDTQIYLSVIDTAEKEAVLMSNWPLWEGSEQFQTGHAPSAENFLVKGYWKQPPKQRKTTEVDYPEYQDPWEQEDHASEE